MEVINKPLLPYTKRQIIRLFIAAEKRDWLSHGIGKPPGEKGKFGWSSVHKC